jgi:hypothetical protein
MAIPTFNQLQKCMAPVWQNKDYQKKHTLGVYFGTVAGNHRAHVESDVDILIVL